MSLEKPKSFVRIYRFCPDNKKEREEIMGYIRAVISAGYKIIHQSQVQNQGHGVKVLQYMGPIHSDGDLHSLRSPARIPYTFTMTTLTITFELR